jgi:hypothetical protein
MLAVLSVTSAPIRSVLPDVSGVLTNISSVFADIAGYVASSKVPALHIALHRHLN